MINASVISFDVSRIVTRTTTRSSPPFSAFRPILFSATRESRPRTRVKTAPLSEETLSDNVALSVLANKRIRWQFDNDAQCRLLRRRTCRGGYFFRSFLALRSVALQFRFRPTSQGEPPTSRVSKSTAIDFNARACVCVCVSVRDRVNEQVRFAKDEKLNREFSVKERIIRMIK